jgi:hypothetical protein
MGNFLIKKSVREELERRGITYRHPWSGRLDAAGGAPECPAPTCDGGRRTLGHSLRARGAGNNGTQTPGGFQLTPDWRDTDSAIGQ